VLRGRVSVITGFKEMLDTFEKSYPRESVKVTLTQYCIYVYLSK